MMCKKMVLNLREKALKICKKTFILLRNIKNFRFYLHVIENRINCALYLIKLDFFLKSYKSNQILLYKIALYVQTLKNMIYYYIYTVKTALV